MSTDICQVLLIEDDPTFALLVERLLSKSQASSLAKGNSFQVTRAATLLEGLEQLAQGCFDVVLLDLMLPDSQGLDTLAQVLVRCPKMPVVVQTGADDEPIVVQAFQMGAHGYLPKHHMDGNLLVYAIRLAIERQLQINRFEESYQQKPDSELKGLEELANSVRTTIASRMFGAQPLREGWPDLFQDFVFEYSKLMDLALEQQTYKVEHNISQKLNAMAEKLGLLKAGPRDVVDIHTKALRQKTQDANLAKAQAYVGEGRLMVLELMGYLTSFYRKYYIGLSNIKIIQSNASGEIR
ncbi:response regulator [[Phormidium] sp. ETS-05]|uniref:response regulator n=1 Tax=[Phormidium] sp. ETS-05 TaxID=222819 RepID=UPI0018EF118F|nr:response regulator [[Phormidium] sp. ETS-05]